MTTRISPHRFAPEMPRRNLFAIAADGEPLDVLSADGSEFASFEMDGRTEVVIAVPTPPTTARVQPASCGIGTEIDGRSVRLTLDRPGMFWITIDSLPPLVLIARLPLPKPPAENARTRIFRAGTATDVGDLILASGESVFIEPGAVVRGCIRAHEAEDVTIGGGGLLDGSPFARRMSGRHGIGLDRCRNAAIRNIIQVRPPGWTCVIGGSEHVAVSGVALIAEGLGSDGIDIVGSRHVRVDDCFLRNGDDNIAVKAINPSDPDLIAKLEKSLTESQLAYRRRCGDWGLDVFDVRIRRCAMYNDAGGGAMEIGYETRTTSMRDILFEEIDVLGVHGHGPVMSIHNGDRAEVRDVTWRDIRVEHHFDKLIDFRVLHSRWNRDPVRGGIRNIVVRDIDVTISENNPGYTVSIVGGFDPQHRVEDVMIENVRFNGRRIQSAAELCLFTRDADRIVVR